MKKQFILTAFIVAILARESFSQDNPTKFEPFGKVTATVFANYHYNFTKDVEKKSQFELLRAYFGYNYQFSEKFSTKILFDAGYNQTIDNTGKATSTFAAFLKLASLQYKMNDKFSVEGGMIATHIFDLQEKFYGYRYILETLQDLNGYYSSADLGVKATFVPVKMLEIHAGIYNGEGYKNIQDNFGIQKATFDVVVKPVDGLHFKAYYDIMSKKDTAITDDKKLQTQSILNFFLGYEKADKFRIGAEYDIIRNAKNEEDRKQDGISAYGTYILKKFEFFARFDQLASNTLTGETDPWNYAKDYSMVLGGVQYAPVKGVKMALDFRHFTPRKSGLELMNLIYLNFEYKF